MLRLRLLFCLALLGLALPTSAGAKESASPGADLTLKDLFAGRSYTRAIPAWRWRPKHSQLVRTTSRRQKKGRATRVLVGMDPVDGKTEDLLDLSALEALVPGKGRAMSGIGRARAPKLTWAPSGKALCVVVKGDLVWVDLEEGTRRRLTETQASLSDLNIAPDDSQVSFSRQSELWVVSTREGKPRRLTHGASKTLLNATLDWVYPEEFGFRTAAWWSGDSRFLAYLQMDESKVPTYRVPQVLSLRSEGRTMFYPKAGDPNPAVRLGVVAAGGGQTIWLDLGSPAPEYIVRVAWRPSRAPETAAALLVVTLDRAQQHLRIHYCDPESGRSRVIHEEKDEAWIAAPPAPRFVDRDHFLWRRQHDSTQWFRMTLNDEATSLSAKAVTPPGVDAGRLLHFEPESGKTLFEGVVHGAVSAGLFAGGLGGSTVVRADFAPEAKLWSSARVDESGTFGLVSRSSAVQPTVTELIRLADGKSLQTIGDARSPRLKKLALAEPEYGQIPLEPRREEVAGQINWRLWKPADFDAQKRYGLIVQVYGGPGSRMVSNKWGRGPLFPTLLTQRGFLVLQVDGRGTGGQGRDFMKCVKGRLGLLELEDQVRAVKLITARPYVDEKRVGIWGWSYGGTMACNALTMRSDVFRAGVAVASVTDWRLYDTIYTERYMGLPKENLEGYDASSSTKFAKQMSGHLLLMHGLGDDNVHAQNTLRLVEAFIKARNLNYDVMLYPRRGHGIGGASLDVFTRLVNYFERYLAP